MSSHGKGAEIIAFPEAEVPPALRAQVVELQREAWPADEDEPPALTHDPALEPLSLLLVAGGRVLAALDLLSKEISHGGERFAASGLSTVVTAPGERRRGRGLTLVAEARSRIEASSEDLAIFTCDLPLERFYERAGFVALPGAVLVGGTPERPLRSDPREKVVMAAFFSPRARAAAAAFEHAEIELYPGEIDRLW